MLVRIPDAWRTWAKACPYYIRILPFVLVQPASELTAAATSRVNYDGVLPTGLFIFVVLDIRVQIWAMHTPFCSKTFCGFLGWDAHPSSMFGIKLFVQINWLEVPSFFSGRMVEWNKLCQQNHAFDLAVIVKIGRNNFTKLACFEFMSRYIRYECPRHPRQSTSSNNLGQD